MRSRVFKFVNRADRLLSPATPCPDGRVAEIDDGVAAGVDAGQCPPHRDRGSFP